METRKTLDLKPHNLNSQIYGDIVLDNNFVNSIKQKGILTAILITYDDRIISGHRRWTVAKNLNLPFVPITVFDSKDELDIEEILVSLNMQREKTAEQKVREYAKLKEIEAERAKRRQEAAGKQYGEGHAKVIDSKSKELVEIFPQALDLSGLIHEHEDLKAIPRQQPIIDAPASKPVTQKRQVRPVKTGRARDLAAKHIGVSGRTAEKALEVIKKTDELKEDGKEQEAKQIIDILNNKSIEKAYQEVKKIEGSAPIPKVKGNATFNKTNENIEWAQWTWNPVTGCKHDCKYCYAHDIATRFKNDGFPQGFEPTFHESRLVAPENTKVPDSQEIGARNVFVCSMADLFGNWVPPEWINAVLNEVKNAPQWNFLFLTKNPERLTTITWPDNAWVGTTVDVQARVIRAEEAFKNIKAKIKFLSCEPLSEALTFSNIKVFDWVIIGARSKNTNLPAIQPDRKWVQSLLIQAWDAGCMTYCKPNLKQCIKEYPCLTQ